MASAQTMQKTLLPAVPLLLRVDSVVRKCVYLVVAYQCLPFLVKSFQLSAAMSQIKCILYKTERPNFSRFQDYTLKGTCAIPPQKFIGYLVGNVNSWQLKCYMMYNGMMFIQELLIHFIYKLGYEISTRFQNGEVSF
jgi:hypothetical protein